MADTNQGSSQGKHSEYGLFGQKIHDNKAIVIQFNHRRTARTEDWQTDKKTQIRSLYDVEHLKSEFKILLLDHL